MNYEAWDTKGHFNLKVLKWKAFYAYNMTYMIKN